MKLCSFFVVLPTITRRAFSVFVSNTNGKKFVLDGFSKLCGGKENSNIGRVIEAMSKSCSSPKRKGSEIKGEHLHKNRKRILLRFFSRVHFDEFM